MTDSGEQTSCSHKWSWTESGRNQRRVSFARSYNDAHVEDKPLQPAAAFLHEDLKKM